MNGDGLIPVAFMFQPAGIRQVAGHSHLPRVTGLGCVKTSDSSAMSGR